MWDTRAFNEYNTAYNNDAKKLQNPAKEWNNVKLTMDNPSPHRHDHPHLPGHHENLRRGLREIHLQWS